MPGDWKASRILLSPVLFVFAGLAFALGQSGPPSPAKSGQSSNAPAAGAPSPEASKYVGADTCKTCHAEIYDSWEKTPHWETTLIF
jgi:cytochrome c5